MIEPSDHVKKNSDHWVGYCCNKDKPCKILVCRPCETFQDKDISVDFVRPCEVHSSKYEDIWLQNLNKFYYKNMIA